MRQIHLFDYLPDCSNCNFVQGKHTYTLRMNHFGDLLPEELLAGYTGHIPIEDSDSAGAA